MIQSLSIKNYKSIKNLDIKTSRINIFIGEHNSGKSNILEALSWFSVNSLDGKIFPEVFRFKSATDFFYDFDTSEAIEVKTDNLNFILRYAKNSYGAIKNELEGVIYESNSTTNPLMEEDWHNLDDKFSNTNYCSFRFLFDGSIENIRGNLKSSFRTYIYKNLKSFEQSFNPYLNPPHGENIPSLLVSNKNYKELVGAIFKEKGFRLMIKPNEGDINMAKDVNEELYAYPYNAISETLQRIIFYTLAIESNKNATLILDEPESNTFPMYTKQLAEQMALDNSNQYFIATHDPYLLGSLVSKTPSKDISIFVTKMDNYETSLSKVDENELSLLLDKGMDVYFNLNKFISE